MVSDDLEREKVADVKPEVEGDADEEEDMNSSLKRGYPGLDADVKVRIVYSKQHWTLIPSRAKSGRRRCLVRHCRRML